MEDHQVLYQPDGQNLSLKGVGMTFHFITPQPKIMLGYIQMISQIRKNPLGAFQISLPFALACFNYFSKCYFFYKFEIDSI